MEHSAIHASGWHGGHCSVMLVASPPQEADQGLALLTHY